MSIEKITKNEGGAMGVDSSGEAISVTGYTYTRNIKKDKNGHYSLSETEAIEPEHKDCFSKKIETQRPGGELAYRYYVKSGIDGSLFDPWGMFSEGTQMSYAKRQGKSSWTFKQVNQQCFEFYNNFLQSRNGAWLKNAERENE
jgi:hypothetical protein